METWENLPHDRHVSTNGQIRQSANSVQGKAIGSDVTTEPTTNGKVVAVDLTVVGYRQIWNLLIGD